MSIYVLGIQFFQEFFRELKVTRFLSVLKFALISFLFFKLFKTTQEISIKFATLTVFFIWFSFWELKRGKSSIYPAYILLITYAYQGANNNALLTGIMSMSIYAYTKFSLKNKYGNSNLIGLVFILFSIALLFLETPPLVTIGLMICLLIAINFLFNPFINHSSHKTEFFLALLSAYLLINETPVDLKRYFFNMALVSVVVIGGMFFLERKRAEYFCISQLSLHLVLLTKAPPVYFIYSLFAVFVIWSSFEYISRNNNDFLSKIIILIFCSDLPLTPFFIAKLKSFTYLYNEHLWSSLVLLILFSSLVTGFILAYSYKSILSYAKTEKNDLKSSTLIYVQRTAIVLFFLLYTLTPLILFKQ